MVRERWSISAAAITENSPSVLHVVMHVTKSWKWQDANGVWFTGRAPEDC